MDGRANGRLGPFANGNRIAINQGSTEGVENSYLANQSFEGRANGRLSPLANDNGTIINQRLTEGVESSYHASQPFEDIGTIGALLNRMESKIRHKYSLGQGGELLADPRLSNEEFVMVDAQVTGNGMQEAVSEVASEAKSAFRQTAEHILMELKKINNELSYEVDVVTVVDPQALEKVLAQLRQKAAYICVGGRYNAGKSTLINALLRSNILPCSRDAETAVTVYVTGEAADTSDERSLDVPRLYSLSQDREEILVCSGADEINKYLKGENSFQRRESELRDKEFVVRTRIPIFSENCQPGESLTPYLVDLPGSNEVCQKKLADVSKLNVETAAAFLYVMTYSELKNDQDFNALKAIYETDRNVFDDGRLMIVVTQYDRFYEGATKDEMSVNTVQIKVVEMIVKALKLSKPVKKELVIPISGLWAYWARISQSTEGGQHRNDVTCSLVTLKRNEGPSVMQEVFNLDVEKSCSTLEEASRIAVLEKQMKQATKSMTGVWKKSIATNCERFVHTAGTALVKLHQNTNSRLKEVKDMLRKATSLYNLHQKILKTIQKNSEVLEDLKHCYDKDTLPGDKLDILIEELVSTLLVQIKSKNKLGNYLPGQLQRDVQDDFRSHAEREMLNFFQQVKYNGCDRALQRAINKMAERCGRLRMSVTFFIKQYQELSLPTMTEEPRMEENLDEIMDRNEEELRELYVPPIQMTVGKWIKLIFSVAVWGLFTFNFVRDEHLKDLEVHLRKELRKFYTDHFRQIREQVLLYFFKIYCHKVEHDLDSFHQLIEGLDVVSLINEHKVCKETLSKQVGNLEQWQRHSLSNLNAKLEWLKSEESL